MGSPKKAMKPIVIKISIPKEFANVMDKELSRIHLLLEKNIDNVWAQSALKEFWGKLDQMFIPAKNIKSEFEREDDDEEGALAEHSTEMEASPVAMVKRTF